MSLYKALTETGLRETRARIAEIVFREQTGLKATEVQQYLRTDYNLQLTISAITKNLQALVEAGFIKKRQKNTDALNHPFYVPNEQKLWLLKTTFGNLQYHSNCREFDNYFRKISTGFQSREGSMKSIADFETELIQFEQEIKKDIISWGPHWWFLKGYKGQVTDMMQKITAANHTITGICFTDNQVARSQAFNAKGDLHIELAIRSGSVLDNLYFYVFGPVVMIARYPQEINLEVDRIYRRYKNLDEVPKKEFEDMLEQRNSIEFTYLVSENLASIFSQEGKRYLSRGAR